VGGVVLAGALGYLAFAGVQGGFVYYLDVAQHVAEGQHPGERVRLHGIVGEGTVLSGDDLVTASFDLCGQSGAVPVRYRGVIPEMFEEGREVVIEGRMDDNGVFQADLLMTKCASKYEEKRKAKETEQAGDEG